VLPNDNVSTTLKEALWITKTPICMNRDAESYQLIHSQDVINIFKGHRNVVIMYNIVQLCRVRSCYINGKVGFNIALQ